MDFLKFANQKEVARLGTKFWGIYAESFALMTSGARFELPTIKLRSGLEQYWIHYIELMRQLSRRDDISALLDKLESAFILRNKDKTIKDDQFEIEGSAMRSVKWDFRKDAILKAASKG